MDQKKSNVYFVWEGDLRIIRIDTASRKIDKNTFGKQTPSYKRPRASSALPALKEGYRKGDFEVIRREKRKMSLIRHVFTSKTHLLVIFEGPVKGEGRSSFWLHFYSLNDGCLQEEVLIPGNPLPNERMCFDKDKNILYSFSGGPDGSEYYIQVYRIIE